MAKIKKMADGGITGLGALLAGAMTPSTPKTASPPEGLFGGFLGGIGGGGSEGGSASEGVDEIRNGAGMVSSAISRASNALGGGGNGLGGGSQPTGGGIDLTAATYKKGGSVKKHSAGGKINLKDSRVSTHQKNPKHKNNW